MKRIMDKTTVETTVTLYMGFIAWKEPMHTWAVKETAIYQWHGSSIVRSDLVKESYTEAHDIRRIIREVLNEGATQGKGHKVKGTTNGHVVEWKIEW